MTKIATLALIASLACVTLVSGQTIDGCSKNCAQCWKNPSPPTGQIQRSCQVCINSAPKITSVAGYFNCSGPAIANCEIHSVDTANLRVSCNLCRVGFMKQTANSVDSCVPLTADFPLCRVGDNTGGVNVSCLVCQSNHAVFQSGAPPQQSRACTPVPPTNLIANCDQYIFSGTAPAINYTCRACRDGFLLSSARDSCSAIPAEQLPCARGFANNANVISCEQCNVRASFFSVDTISTAGDTPATLQRQICRKGSAILMIIIIVVVAVILLVVIIVLLKKRKEKNESQLRGSMLGGY